MFTDIAGFTSLAANDENKALQLLEEQKLLLGPIVNEFNGILHKEIGDGMLFTFSTVTDAIKCGIKIQKATSSNENLNLRIGIHQGEIVIKDGDVLGDDINIASRIEPYAASGGIAISGKVQQDISSLPEFKTKFISEPRLKGVKQDIKIYCIISHNLPESNVSKITAKLEKDVKKIWFNQRYIIASICLLAIFIIGIYIFFPKYSKVPSVAILMMENLGSDNDNFWSRGITEDLIIKVAGAGLIRVPSMHEIKKIKEIDSFEEIAKELKVEYILTSSIHKKENVFDLRSQLIEIKSGKSLYGNKWSETIENAPGIVDDLSNIILNNLGIKNKRAIDNSSSYKYNSEAYEYYLRAKDTYDKKKNFQDLEESILLLTKAIQIDEKLVPALNTLAIIYSKRRDWKSVETHKKNMSLALEYAQKALNISYEKNNIELIANSHYTIGTIYLHLSSKHEQTIENLQKALSLFENQNNKHGIKKCLTALAIEYNNQSYRKQSIKEYDLSMDYIKIALNYYLKSFELNKELNDETNIIISLNNLSSHYKTRFLDLDKSIEYSTKALKKLDYKSHSIDLKIKTYTNLGDSYLMLGDYNKSNIFLKRALELLLPLEEYDVQNVLIRLAMGAYFNSNYTESINYLTKATDLHFEGIQQNRILHIHTLLFLSNQKINNSYNKSFIYENLDQLTTDDYILNYLVYLATNEKFFINQSHTALQIELLKCDSKIKKKYLNYPICQAILEDYHKVFK